jgi:cytochrome c biogenesis protein CcmG/thiol:disulfide interchange protein DsbE
MSDVDVAEPAARPDAPAVDRRRVAPFVVLGVALVVGALFVVLASSKSGRNETVDTFLKGKPAPGAVSTTLDGQPFDLSRRKGSWVVLNFFDPTCVPCKHEHPELIAFEQQQAAIPDGAELYTVINRGTDQAVRDYFAENGGDWPVVRDPDGRISVAFGVSQVPETWIIDPDGIVRERFAGEITADSLGTLLQQYRELRG